MSSRKVVPAVVLAALSATPIVNAQIVLDGVLDSFGYTNYAIQTNNTQFGDNFTDSSGNSAGGTELDAAYAKVEGGYLKLLFTGNFQNNFNHLNIFIDDGRAGQTTLDTTGGQMGPMDGSKFSTGFTPTYVLDLNCGGGPLRVFADKYDLTQANGPRSFIGDANANDATAHLIGGGVFLSLNNTNIAGVDGSAPSAASEPAALAVTTGMEVAIPLVALGGALDNIRVLASINGGGNNFLSNQFLPGLQSVTGNLGTPNFNFESVANMFFSVGNAAPTGVWQGTSFDWGNAFNWAGAIPQNAGDSVAFTDAGGGIPALLNGNRTVGRITFDSDSGYAIGQGSGGVLTIDDTGDSPGSSPSIAVRRGQNAIGAPVVIANGLTVNAAAGSSIHISGDMSGSGDLLKIGTGTLGLAGSNSYSGNIQAHSGVVNLGGSDSAGTGLIFIGDRESHGQAATIVIGATGLTIPNVIVTSRDLDSSNSLRTISATYSGGNSTLTGNMFLDGGVVFAASSGATLTVNSAIANGEDTSPEARRAIHIGGTGTVVLGGVSTSTGDVFVDSGTLNLASTASLASGSINVFTSGTAFLNGTLIPAVKIYSAGTVHIPGNDGSLPALNLGSIQVDSTGSVTIWQSTSNLAPRTVTLGAIDFFSNPNPTGKLDLKNNRLITSNTQDVVRQQLLAGNILTTAPGGTLGYKDNGGATTLLQFTVQGDANLDGVANALDFNALATNFGATGAFWLQGDFDYNGIVETPDFNLLSANFGNVLLAAPPAFGALVPEPSMLAVGLIGLPLLARRKRSN